MNFLYIDNASSYQIYMLNKQHNEPGQIGKIRGSGHTYLSNVPDIVYGT
jgi:hypothetical protein